MAKDASGASKCGGPTMWESMWHHNFEQRPRGAGIDTYERDWHEVSILKQSQSNRCGGISSGQHWAFARELVLRTLRENHRHRHDIGSDIRHRHFSHTAEVPQPAATVPHNWSLLPTHYIYKARYSPPPRHPSLLPAPPLQDPPTPHHPRLPPSSPASRPLLELCSRAHRM